MATRKPGGGKKNFMKILLSAYACEPNKGSEPGIGWYWAVEIAQLGHEVWVLTRAKNRQNIENELSRVALKGNIRFLYYDLPPWIRWWKRGVLGLYLYYSLWQWGAYLFAKKVHGTEKFDLVHHITFGNLRQPGFMGNLDIPFILGPVGGGERAPWRLWKSYGIKGWILDAIRYLLNCFVKIDPFARKSFKQAKWIYGTSEQTISILPRKYQTKASVQLAVGLDKKDLLNVPRKKHFHHSKKNPFSVIYVGRFLSWKGMEMGLKAFARLLKEAPDARLTLVGKGPDEHRLRTLATKLAVAERVEWISWLDRNELLKLYVSHDVFLFPSLHDSGGSAILEALAHGLPVICLDLGGPGKIVDETCGLKVKTEGLSKQDTVLALENYMKRLAKDLACRNRLSEGAVERAKELSWSAHVGKLYAADKILT